MLCSVSGGELFERIIDEDFELTEREVIKYMLQIVDGVSFIHKKGIVHLDLKPENIMCVNKTGSKIKLIDFGLARRLGTSLVRVEGNSLHPLWKRFLYLQFSYINRETEFEKVLNKICTYPAVI